MIDKKENKMPKVKLTNTFVNSVKAPKDKEKKFIVILMI